MDKLALAVGGTPIPVPSGVPTGGLNTAGGAILRASITLLFIVAVVLSLIFLIWGGIRWITSRGDPKAVEGARNQITYAIIGLVLTFLAFTIVSFITRSFRIPLF